MRALAVVVAAACFSARSRGKSVVQPTGVVAQLEVVDVSHHGCRKPRFRLRRVSFLGRHSGWLRHQYTRRFWNTFKAKPVQNGRIRGIVRVQQLKESLEISRSIRGDDRWNVTDCALKGPIRVCK